MLDNKTQRRPVIDPMLLALKSRRVVVALAALIIGVLSLAVPEVQAVRAELLTLLVTFSLAIIGGYTLEDAVAAGRQRSGQPEEDLRQLIKDVLDSLFDEMSSTPPNT
jgi:uncharacterized protein YebE (UPF0316 family)